MGMDGQQFYEQQDADKTDVKSSSSSERNKAKAKSKDSSGGNSLLNVRIMIYYTKSPS